MKIAVIILHYGALERTRDSLTNLRSRIGEHQLILVNNTRDNVASLTTIIKGTKVIDNKKNLGFARAVNQGIALALADKSITHVLLLNNDLAIRSGTLDELHTVFKKHKEVGIVSPLLHHRGGYDWGGHYNRWTGMVRHTNWGNPPKTILSVDHVAGAAMLIPREVIERVGPFDERYFLYFEDLDFCLRVKQAGYSIRISPSVIAEHSTSASSRLLWRTLHQWRSHLLFVFLHLPRTALPTAVAFDLVAYPLFLLKALFRRQ